MTGGLMLILARLQDEDGQFLLTTEPHFRDPHRLIDWQLDVRAVSDINV